MHRIGKALTVIGSMGSMIAALVLMAGLFVAPARAAPPGATVLELKDSVLVGMVWHALYSDSSRPTGEFQILIPDPNPGHPVDAANAVTNVNAGDSAQSQARDRNLQNTVPENMVFVLRNGTEIGRLGRSEWDALASRVDEDGYTAQEDGAENTEIPFLWKSLPGNREALLALMEWPAGLELRTGASVGALRKVSLQYQRDLDILWSQKLLHHYLLGVSLHRSQFGGGLTRLGLETAPVPASSSLAASAPASAVPTPAATAAASKPSPDFWGDAFWWWSVSVGVPGLKYTLESANRPLPEYYWLEPDASKSIQTRKPGSVVTQWTGGNLEKTGNFSHTLEARLGYLRYKLVWDADAYANGVLVHDVAMEDLPAVFGTWGVGFVAASGMAATRFWLDIPDLGFGFRHPRAYPSDFRLALLRIDMSYRTVRNFEVGLSVRLHIENPIMNRPGAIP